MKPNTVLDNGINRTVPPSTKYLLQQPIRKSKNTNFVVLAIVAVELSRIISNSEKLQLIQGRSI